MLFEPIITSYYFIINEYKNESFFIFWKSYFENNYPHFIDD